MTKYALLITLVTCCLAIRLSAQPLAQKPTHRAGEILFQTVGSKPSADVIELFETIFVSKQLINSDSKAYQCTAIAPNTTIYKLRFDPSVFDEKKVLSALRNHSGIRHAQFNRYTQQRNTEPNDPLYKDQWYLRRVVAPAVWHFTKGGVTACGDTIVVAVVDSGFDIDHNDLKDNIWLNRGEIPNNRIDDDQNGFIDDYKGLNSSEQNDQHEVSRHGTQCAGVIGAKGNNNLGISGINWNIKLLVLSGNESEEDLIRSFQYALDLRKKYNQNDGKSGAFVSVLSMSLGFKQGRPEDFPLTCGMFDKLSEVGILSVVAADNVNKNIDEYGDVPALCPSKNLIVVTRTDTRDALPESAGFSPRSVDLGAPGQGVLLLSLNNGYGTDNGNSFATPLVAGSAALLMSIPQDTICKIAKKTPQAVVEIIRDVLLSGVDASIFLKDKTVTGGRLNVLKSFELLKRRFGMPVGEHKILSLFPNPTIGNISVALQLPENPNADIVVTNALGQVVFQRRITDNDLLQKTLNLETKGWASGVYGISILTSNIKTSSTFFITR